VRRSIWLDWIIPDYADWKLPIKVIGNTAMALFVLCLLGRECAFDGWRLTQTDTILVLTQEDLNASKLDRKTGFHVTLYVCA